MRIDKKVVKDRIVFGAIENSLICYHRVASYLIDGS